MILQHCTFFLKRLGGRFLTKNDPLFARIDLYGFLYLHVGFSGRSYFQLPSFLFDFSIFSSSLRILLVLRADAKRPNEQRIKLVLPSGENISATKINRRTLRPSFESKQDLGSACERFPAKFDANKPSNRAWISVSVSGGRYLALPTTNPEILSVSRCLVDRNRTAVTLIDLRNCDRKRK